MKCTSTGFVNTIFDTHTRKRIYMHLHRFANACWFVSSRWCPAVGWLKQKSGAASLPKSTMPETLSTTSTIWQIVRTVFGSKQHGGKKLNDAWKRLGLEGSNGVVNVFNGILYQYGMFHRLARLLEYRGHSWSQSSMSKYTALTCALSTHIAVASNAMTRYDKHMWWLLRPLDVVITLYEMIAVLPLYIFLVHIEKKSGVTVWPDVSPSLACFALFSRQGTKFQQLGHERSTFQHKSPPYDSIQKAQCRIPLQIPQQNKIM